MDLDPDMIDTTINVYFTEMRALLEKAACIAQAAEACAVSGSVEKGIEIALDLEEIVYEVNTFLNAASMFNRLGKA